MQYLRFYRTPYLCRKHCSKTTIIRRFTMRRTTKSNRSLSMSLRRKRLTVAMCPIVWRRFAALRRVGRSASVSLGDLNYPQIRVPDIEFLTLRAQNNPMLANSLSRINWLVSRPFNYHSDDRMVNVHQSKRYFAVRIQHHWDWPRVRP